MKFSVAFLSTVNTPYKSGSYCFKNFLDYEFRYSKSMDLLDEDYGVFTLQSTSRPVHSEDYLGKSFPLCIYSFWTS